VRASVDKKDLRQLEDWNRSFGSFLTDDERSDPNSGTKSGQANDAGVTSSGSGSGAGAGGGGSSAPLGAVAAAAARALAAEAAAAGNSRGGSQD